MPILFSAIVKNHNIISEFASCDGNFIEILQQMIPKIPPRDEKMTYYHGPYLIHYVMEDKRLYFCITDKMCQRSRAFLFLNEINRQFQDKRKDDFLKMLAERMYTYSEDYSTIIVRKGELDELNKIGVESSETILGEKVLIVNNPENISYATISYVGKSPEQLSISEKPKYVSHQEHLEPDITTEKPKTVIAHMNKPIELLPISEEKLKTQLAQENSPPEQTSVSDNKLRLYMMAVGVLIIIIGMIYALSPMSCTVFVAVIGYSFVRFYGTDNKYDFKQ